MTINKTFYYKIYDSSTLVTVWSEDVFSDPRFTVGINNGPGELNIKLARSFDNFGEGSDVKLNNKVECWCVDKDSPSGILIYAGFISGYKPVFEEDNQYIEVTVLGFIDELNRMVLRDVSGNTTLAYNSQDPANILKDVLVKYNALGGRLGFTSSSITLTNTVVSYTFNTNTIKECLDKIIELCPLGWYYRIDPTGFVFLAPKSATAIHTFSVGTEIENLETFRRVENMVNRVLVIGGGSPALFRKYENTSAQATYGLYELVYVDQRITVVATAAIIAQRIIDDRKDPEIRSTFVIVDNSGARGMGYDIESIKVGQTLRVRNLFTSGIQPSLWDKARWDVDVWDQSLAASAADVIQILSIGYTPDSITVEASSRLPQVAKRIEDINRNLQTSQMVNNPTVPS